MLQQDLISGIMAFSSCTPEMHIPLDNSLFLSLGTLAATVPPPCSHHGSHTTV